MSDTRRKADDGCSVETGSRHRHFKGNEYIVLMLARDSETGEEVVVYRDCADEGKVWVRPLRMFLEKAEVDGRMVCRFELLKPGGCYYEEL